MWQQTNAFLYKNVQTQFKVKYIDCCIEEISNTNKLRYDYFLKLSTFKRNKTRKLLPKNVLYPGQSSTPNDFNFLQHKQEQFCLIKKT